MFGKQEKPTRFREFINPSEEKTYPTLYERLTEAQKRSYEQIIAESYNQHVQYRSTKQFSYMQWNVPLLHAVQFAGDKNNPNCLPEKLIQEAISFGFVQAQTALQHYREELALKKPNADTDEAQKGILSVVVKYLHL